MKQYARWPTGVSENLLFQLRIRISATGCWEWTGRLDKDGYGRFYGSIRNSRAHRWSYTHWVGQIPEGLVLDHLCRNRKCVRPDHLEAVTTGENVARSFNRAANNRRKTHCKYGHEFSPDNLMKSRKGYRLCKRCASRRNRERYARRVGRAA